MGGTLATPVACALLLLTIPGCCGLELSSSSASADFSVAWRVDQYPVATFRHSEQVRGVAVTPGGAHAVSASADRTLKMWDLRSRAAGPTAAFVGHTDEVKSVAVTPDGAYAVSGSLDRTVRLWDLSSRAAAPIATFAGHTDWVHSVAVTPDGAYALSGSADFTVKMWGLRSRAAEPVVTFAGHTGPVRSVAVTPDGAYVVSGGDDQALMLWDLRARAARPIATSTGHGNRIVSLAVTPDGAYAVSGSADHMVKLWDLRFRTLEPITTFWEHADRVNSVAVTPDGAHAVSGSADQTMRLWDLRSRAPEPVATFAADHTDFGEGLAVTPDGTYVLSGSRDQTVKLWDLRSRSAEPVVRFAAHADATRTVAVTPDGAYAVSGSLDATLKLWDLRSRPTEPVATFSGHQGGVCEVAVTPDGAYAVSGSDDATVKLWDLHSRSAQPAATFAGHAQAVSSVAVTPDGAYAASGSHDGTVKLWDLRSRAARPVSSFAGHAARVYSVRVTPDGAYVVSGSADSTVKLWDLRGRTAQPAATFARHTGGVHSVALTPDGAYLVSGARDGTLKLWDLRSRAAEPVATFGNHTDGVDHVRVTPDGAYAVSSSRDRTVKLWDLRNHAAEPVASLKVKQEINALGVLPDSDFIILGIGQFVSITSWQSTAHFVRRLGNSSLCQEHACTAQSVHGRGEATQPVDFPSWWFARCPLQQVNLTGVRFGQFNVWRWPESLMSLTLSGAEFTGPSRIQIHGSAMRLLDLRGVGSDHLSRIDVLRIERKRAARDCFQEFAAGEPSCLVRGDLDTALLEPQDKTCATTLYLYLQAHWIPPAFGEATRLAILLDVQEEWEYHLCDCRAGYFGNGSHCTPCWPDAYCTAPDLHGSVAGNEGPTYCPPSSGTDGAHGAANRSSCTCKPGWSTSGSSGDPCRACPEGRVTRSYAEAALGECTTCPVGHAPAEGKSRCDVCPEGETSAGGDRCRPCAQDEVLRGAVCRKCPPLGWANSGRTCDIHLQAVVMLTMGAGAVGLAILVPGMRLHRRVRILDITRVGAKAVVKSEEAHHMAKRHHGATKVRFGDTGIDVLDSTDARWIAQVSGPDELELHAADNEVLTPDVLGKMESSMGHCVETAQSEFSRSRTWSTRLAAIAVLLALSGVLLGLQDRQNKPPALAAYAVAAALSSVAVWLARWSHKKVVSRHQQRIRAYRSQLLERNPSPQRCKRGPNRAVTAKQLVDLHHYFAEFIRERTAYYLDANITRPITRPLELSFAELAGPKEAMHFVSHFYGTRFVNFVTSIRRHAELLYQANWETASYYICFLSNNQWDIKNEMGNGKWDQSSFYLTLSSDSCQSTALILDAEASAMTRTWCIFEIFHSFQKRTSNDQNLVLDLCTERGVLGRGKNLYYDIALALGERLTKLSIADASTLCKEDDKMIKDLIEKQPGGLAALDEKVRYNMWAIMKRVSFHFEVTVEKLNQDLQEASIGSAGDQPAVSGGADFVVSVDI